MSNTEEIQKIATAFGINEVRDIRLMSGGHINETWHLTAEGGEYILQALGGIKGFDGQAIMENIAAVQETFLLAGSEAPEIPQYRRAGGRNYFPSADRIYRVYPYITEYPLQQDREYRMAYAFGSFIKFMGRCKADLKQGISGYHDRAAYVQAFRDHTKHIAIRREHLDLLKLLEETDAAVEEAFTEEVGKRVIHGDARAANFIQGRESGVILDLDTVMVHYVALDYGDMIRSAGTDREKLERITAGFMKALGDVLTEKEKASLYYGILWVMEELAVRYLTDYYAEGKYFRDLTEQQREERAFHLAEQIKYIEAEKNGIINTIYNN